MSAADAPVIPGLEFVRPLGSGGYADVYLYEQQSPRMNVAVKVLKKHGLTPAIRRQFVDEANTMAQLADHPYIVQVFRSDQTAEGGAYLVMKYYPPPNLAQRARAERLGVEEVLRTGIQLASAVETAHRAGIVHRDIKPANVLVSQYGQPGLTDFGIAGRGAAEDPDEDVGVSVPWSAPEVLYGQSNGDARSDVYSLAATLWHLLVGRSPFEQPGGDNSAYGLMPRIRSVPVPATGRADVPVSLERLLAHAMAKSPDARPQSALELARGLQAVEQEQRLPRTAVVVLDEQGRSTVAEGGPRRADAAQDADRTSVRPVTVPSGTPAGSHHAPSDLADDGPTTVSGGVVVGVLVVLLAALAGIAWWAFGRSDDGGTPDPSPTVRAQSVPPSRAVEAPGQPVVDATSTAGSVTFTWNYGGVEGGDFSRIQTAPEESGVYDAPVVVVKGARTHTVKVASGRRVCALVVVSRSSGVDSPDSRIRCETAR